MFKDVSLIFIIVATIWGVCLFLLGYFLRIYVARKRLSSAEEKAKAILENAEKETRVKNQAAELDAKDLLLKTRTDFEKETKSRREELIALERRLIQKEENLDRKVDLLDKKEREIVNKERGIHKKIEQISLKQRELENVLEQEKNMLQKIAHLTAEEAKQLLLRKLENEVKRDSDIMVNRLVNEAKDKADKESRKIIGLAIQRYAAEHTVESTVSVVNLPNDEMKGRIIGREGRNIRALEIATGIDVIIDDTPEAVILSGFDMVRREIARISLERLIEDGRIHPGRIEEIVEKVKKEMEVTIREEGERAIFDLGLHNVHPEIVRLVGRLRFRTSYGQNVLQHSKEVAYLMGVMASELKVDPTLAKRIGLFHDIGKAVSHEVEGTHAKIGADLARKYGENENVIHPIEAHHEDIEPRTLLAVLVQASDSVSASRPGARRETLEKYIKRLEKLESIADSFKGVDKAYAIQAGREIRVIVKPEKISDEEASTVARNITKKIEESLEYPGQIKVTVIRETRAIEYAK